MSDREWCWVAAIVSIIALGVHPSAWVGIVAISLVWALLASGDENSK